MTKYKFTSILFESCADWDKEKQIVDALDQIAILLEKKDEEIAELKEQLSDLKILVYDLESRLDTHLEYGL